MPSNKELIIGTIPATAIGRLHKALAIKKHSHEGEKAVFMGVPIGFIHYICDKLEYFLQGGQGVNLTVQEADYISTLLKVGDHGIGIEYDDWLKERKAKMIFNELGD